MQPEYRDVEAMQQAEREEDEDYVRDEAPHQRSRYVLDEAECSDDDGGDDDDDGDGGFGELKKSYFASLFFLMR